MKSRFKIIVKNNKRVLMFIALGISVIAVDSCKKIVKDEYTCRCQCYDISNGTTQEVSRETIYDTEEKARKRCEDKWVGDECGCTIL